MRKDLIKELNQCGARARECEEQAQTATNDQTREELLLARDRWVRLERGYQVAQAFIKDAEARARGDGT
jgi:hypothetical protein